VGTLARVPLAGGAPREILENVQDADWSPDGKSLAVARQSGNRNRIEYPIGTVLYDAPGWVNDLRVSPDGRLVAFIDHPRRGDNVGTVKVIDTAGKVRLTGPDAFRGLAWSPRGDEVWSSGNGISGTSLSGKSRLVWNSPGAILMDIARDGRALLSVNSSRREMVGFAAGEKAERNLTWLNWSFPKDISSDGKTLLFEEQNIQPKASYLRKLDGSPAVRIGEGGSWGFSPDGRWVLSMRDDQICQFTLLPTGAGEPKQLPRAGINCRAAAWFPDGRRILISASEPGHGSRPSSRTSRTASPAPSLRKESTFCFTPFRRTESRSRRGGRTAESPSTRPSPASLAQYRTSSPRTFRSGGRPTALRSSFTAGPRLPSASKKST
jgi:Tol biopolymer transport system component